MPELPEVESFRRKWERLAKGRLVDDALVDARGRMLLAPARAIESALEGSRLGDARRIGKWLFARADAAALARRRRVDDASSAGDAWLVLHFGMTGDVEAFTDEPPRFARLALRLHGGGGVAFTDPRRFGKIGLTRSAEEFAQAHDLGPDALGIARRAFVERLASRRGTIKAVLLDQSAIAGVGNLWADESLWRARIHPATPVARVDLAALHRALTTTLRAAVKRAEKDPWFSPPRWLLSHRARGDACPRCGAKLARGTIAGRTTFWCPREQRRD